MTIHKFKVRMNINEDRGSGTIYLSKELVQKIVSPGSVKTSGIREKADLMAYYNDENDEMLIKEPE